MSAIIKYSVYTWSPPQLSSSEMIALGREVARVGRKSFAIELKKRLSAPAGTTKAVPFTYADVIRDAEERNKAGGAQQPTSWGVLLLALAFFGACVWFIVADGELVPFVVTAAIIGSLSIGSLMWVHGKVDRWAQSLIDAYNGEAETLTF